MFIRDQHLRREGRGRSGTEPWPEKLSANLLGRCEANIGHQSGPHRAGMARALDPDGLHSVTDVGFPEKDVTSVTAALWGEADPEGDAGCRSSFLLP